MGEFYNEYRWKKIGVNVECRNMQGTGQLVATVYECSNKNRPFRLYIPEERVKTFKTELEAVTYATEFLTARMY